MLDLCLKTRGTGCFDLNQSQHSTFLVQANSSWCLLVSWYQTVTQILQFQSSLHGAKPISGDQVPGPVVLLQWTRCNVARCRLRLRSPVGECCKSPATPALARHSTFPRLHQPWILGFKLNSRVSRLKAEARSLPLEREGPDSEPSRSTFEKGRTFAASPHSIGSGEKQTRIWAGRQRQQMAKQVIGLRDNRGRDIDAHQPKCPPPIHQDIYCYPALYRVTATLVSVRLIHPH